MYSTSLVISGIINKPVPTKIKITNDSINSCGGFSFINDNLELALPSSIPTSTKIKLYK